MFGGGFPNFMGGGINPEMMKQASAMMANMSDDELRNYAKMAGN